LPENAAFSKTKKKVFTGIGLPENPAFSEKKRSSPDLERLFDPETAFPENNGPEQKSEGGKSRPGEAAAPPLPAPMIKQTTN